MNLTEMFCIHVRGGIVVNGKKREPFIKEGQTIEIRNGKVNQHGTKPTHGVLACYGNWTGMSDLSAMVYDLQSLELSMVSMDRIGWE